MVLTLSCRQVPSQHVGTDVMEVRREDPVYQL